MPTPSALRESWHALRCTASPGSVNSPREAQAATCRGTPRSSTQGYGALCTVVQLAPSTLNRSSTLTTSLLLDASSLKCNSPASCQSSSASGAPATHQTASSASPLARRGTLFPTSHTTPNLISPHRLFTQPTSDRMLHGVAVAGRQKLDTAPLAVVSAQHLGGSPRVRMSVGACLLAGRFVNHGHPRVAGGLRSTVWSHAPVNYTTIPLCAVLRNEREHSTIRFHPTAGGVFTSEKSDSRK